jgi:hypothetical protein
VSPVSHRPAPAIVNGAGPYLTVGLRARWWTLEQWLALAWELQARRCSAGTYQKQAAHLDELARHPHVVAKGSLEGLRQAREFLERPAVRPARGQRGGTSWERLVVCVNNAIAHHIHAEQLEVAVRSELAALLEEGHE